MNAEVFAKGLEKCRLLTRLLGQNVENLDDYGCPKKSRSCQNLQFVDLCNYTFRDETKLNCAERKAKMYVEWAMQHL